MASLELVGAPSSSHVCAVNTWLATWLFDLGFESCNRDCLGSAVTDGMLAAHALWSAWRLRSWLARTRQQQVQREAITRAATQSHSTGPTGCSYATQPSMLLLTREDSRWSFGTLAVTLMATNGVWASVGASYWLQPGGQRWPTPEIFEVLWRINSLCQALLIYVAYLVALTIIRIGGVWPAVARHEPLLLRLALVHAAIFGLVCLWPGLCAQRDYVLWGGVNIMPPLLTQWGAIVTLVLRHRLHRSLESLAVPRRDGTVAFGLWLPRHALFGAAASGIWFWLGNSAIFLGRHQGLALWMRQAASRLLRLDPEGLDPECVPRPGSKTPLIPLARTSQADAPSPLVSPRPPTLFPSPIPSNVLHAGAPPATPTTASHLPHLARSRRARACFVLALCSSVAAYPLQPSRRWPSSTSSASWVTSFCFGRMGGSPCSRRACLSARRPAGRPARRPRRRSAPGAARAQTPRRWTHARRQLRPWAPAGAPRASPDGAPRRWW